MSMHLAGVISLRAGGCCWALILALGAWSPAAAEHLVTFTSGSTLEIEGYRMEKDLVILSLRGGGEIGCKTRQIARIEKRAALPVQAAPEAKPEGPLPTSSPAGLRDADPPFEPLVSPWDPVPGVRALIQRVAGSLEVDPKLVEALVHVESNYDPFAVSHRGAMGLMQLMPETARRFQVANVFDPVQNLEGGTRYLKELLGRYGEIRLALAAYNAGEQAVDRYRGVPPYGETRTYVGRILRVLQP